jgi:cobalt-precorrin 5A hydrolase
MGGDEAMIAIGIGCRRGAKAGAIIDLVRTALIGLTVADEPVALYSVEDKQDETGLIEAAADLHWPLRFLSRAALQRVEPAVLNPSHHAEAALGIASVSEAAALVGAGRAARLLVPRMKGDGVTCAIARGAGQ